MCNGKGISPAKLAGQLRYAVLVTFILVLLVAGCAKKVPVASEAPEAETTGTQSTSVSTPPGTEEDSVARRERELQAAIEERERKVVEESMRRRFGEPVQTMPPTMSREEFASQDVHFAYNSFTLSEESRTILEQKGTWLTENPDTTVQIEGHCDERGTTAYNLALGERRANTVKQYLVALGVNASRLSTISYGEEFPLDPDHNGEAWARNRRAHFVLTSQ
jgi:peptidoglycan-associated lipoprotein